MGRLTEQKRKAKAHPGIAELGKSSRISKEWNKRKLTSVQYLLLSWHLIEAIKFDLNNHSVKKVASILHHVVRK